MPFLMFSLGILIVRCANFVVQNRVLKLAKLLFSRKCRALSY